MYSYLTAFVLLLSIYQCNMQPVNINHMMFRTNGQNAETDHITDERARRTINLVQIGAAAAKALLDTAKSMKTYSKGFNTFWKEGSKNTAREDFKSVNPTDVRRYVNKYGDQVLEGKIGDRIIYYRSRDRAVGKHPTVTIYDPKRISAGVENLSDRIVYKQVRQPVDNDW